MSKSGTDSRLNEVAQQCEVAGLVNYSRLRGDGKPGRTTIANLSNGRRPLYNQLVRLGIFTAIDDNGKTKLKRILIRRKRIHSRAEYAARPLVMSHKNWLISRLGGQLRHLL